MTVCEWLYNTAVSNTGKEKKLLLRSCHLLSLTRLRKYLLHRIKFHKIDHLYSYITKKNGILIIKIQIFLQFMCYSLQNINT